MKDFVKPLDFKRMLAGFNAAIGFEPMSDEVSYNWAWFLRPILKKEKTVIPAKSDIDPIKWAADCAAMHKDANVVVFIPGRRFDVYGTRHGRGSGWYDRFLGATPIEWLRVGVTDISRLSLSPLERKLHDQPVDFIMALSARSVTGDWKIHQTDARTKKT